METGNANKDAPGERNARDGMVGVRSSRLEWRPSVYVPDGE
jgi:hypothetical protein